MALILNWPRIVLFLLYICSKINGENSDEERRVVHLMLGFMNSCLTCPAVTVKLEETLGLEHRGESTVTLTCVVRDVVTKSSTLMLMPLFSM